MNALYLLASAAPRRLCLPQRPVSSSPCELPFPEILGQLHFPRVGARRGSRFALDRKAKTWANALFALYSWYAIGAIDISRGAPAAYSSQPVFYESIRRSAELLLESIRRFFRVGGRGPLTGGRLRIADALREASAASYGHAPAGSGADWIDPDAIDLPECAGGVSLPDLLLEWQHEAYLDPGMVLPEIWRQELPRPCNRLRPSEERPFMERLLAWGMAGFMPETELLQDHGVPVVGQLFAVPKPDKGGRKRQRLIFDRRPQNTCEKRFSWVWLPHAVLFVRMRLKCGYGARGHGKDLRSFYHALRHSKAWHHRNAVGPVLNQRLTAKWQSKYVGARPFDKHGRHRLVFLVAGMGDQNAVGLATAAHINVLTKRGLLPRSEGLALGSPVPSGLQWSGVYIDDWLTVRQVRRENAREWAEDAERAKQVSAAYVEEGLPEETDKAFNGDVNFRAWGAEFRGGAGTLGAPVEARYQLFLITLALIQFKWITKHILQQVLGLFASVLIFKRVCFSSFQ